jgi:hypothetical protein
MEMISYTNMSFGGTWTIRSDDRACNKGRMSEGSQNDDKYKVGRFSRLLAEMDSGQVEKSPSLPPFRARFGAHSTEGYKVEGQIAVQLTTDLHLIPRS